MQRTSWNPNIKLRGVETPKVENMLESQIDIRQIEITYGVRFDHFLESQFISQLIELIEPNLTEN